MQQNKPTRIFAHPRSMQHFSKAEEIYITFLKGMYITSSIEIFKMFGPKIDFLIEFFNTFLSTKLFSDIKKP